MWAFPRCAWTESHRSTIRCWPVQKWCPRNSARYPNRCRDSRPSPHRSKTIATWIWSPTTFDCCRRIFVRSSRNRVSSLRMWWIFYVFVLLSVSFCAISDRLAPMPTQPWCTCRDTEAMIACHSVNEKRTGEWSWPKLIRAPINELFWYAVRTCLMSKWRISFMYVGNWFTIVK